MSWLCAKSREFVPQERISRPEQKLRAWLNLRIQRRRSRRVLIQDDVGRVSRRMPIVIDAQNLQPGPLQSVVEVRLKLVSVNNHPIRISMACFSDRLFDVLSISRLCLDVTHFTRFFAEPLLQSRRTPCHREDCTAASILPGLSQCHAPHHMPCAGFDAGIRTYQQRRRPHPASCTAFCRTARFNSTNAGSRASKPKTSRQENSPSRPSPP